MRYSQTAIPSSETGSEGRGSPRFYLWDTAPDLGRQLLAALRPEPGSCRPLPPESEWTRVVEREARVILTAADHESLPWAAIEKLRSDFDARLLLLLPDCDARNWWRLTRRGFCNVLSPPFTALDPDLEFGGWDRSAPLAQRLPDLDARLRSKLEFSFPADLKYVSPAAGLISRLAREHGFHPRVWAENLPLALGEALTNAVEHGSRGDSSLSVSVQLRIDHDVLKVRIEDEGDGFDCVRVADPHAEEGLRRGSGRGLLLMRALLDRVIYEEDGRVVLLYARRMPPEREESATEA